MIFYATSVMLAVISLITGSIGALILGLMMSGLGMLSEKWR